MLRKLWPILVLAASCGEAHEPSGLQFDDPLHEHGIRLPPPADAVPDRAQVARPAQVFPVPPPPLSEGVFPCSRCHVGGSEPPPDERPFTPHATHLAQDLLCADCHGEKDPKVPAPSLCLECHEEAELPAPLRAGFVRRWRTADTIAAHARHAEKGVACAECHGEPTDRPFAKPKSVALMERCLDCHQRRAAPAECATCHTETRLPRHGVVLRHAEDQRGCLDCHNPADRDTLRLANGTPVPFEKSYLLCGQCHGTHFKDWKQGLHGKRTGMWDGERHYLLCVHCHQDPHAPQPPPMVPDPPPVRPEDIR